jgi:uncharacterized protein YdaL
VTDRNLPTLRSIAVDGAVLKDLPLDALDALLSEAEAENKIISAAKRAITSHIDARFAPEIAEAYDIKGADFGTVHVTIGEFDIEVNTPKKAEWDQKKLASIVDEIRTAGDDPTEFVKVEYAVEEKKYAAWPSYLQTKFEPARTLKPGTRTLKLARAKQEAA